MSVLLETSLGEIVIDLFVDDCPRACLNFLKLCKTKYFNFHLFHNVQRGFIAQTGDPTGTGKGGQSIYGILNGPSQKYFAPDKSSKQMKHNRRGLVSMASLQGGGTDADGVQCVHGSQFFITLGDRLDYLDGKHTIFGEVAEGLETLENIENAFVDNDGRPLQDIRIKHTIVLDDPFPDPEGLARHIPERSPEPTKEMLESGRIRDDEALEDDAPAEIIEERLKEKEARAKTKTLEMLGDLPFAEIKPPENVLFVCKLNPVTNDEDLELIFSRFGKINSCEVIRDKLTGDSLRYAFVEFDEKEACEEAYFKMQNVLIDDCRIHVDFSQSVSKLHGVWLDKRRQEMERHSELGAGLQRKRQYRDEATKVDRYEYVHEHEHSRRSSRSKSPSYRSERSSLKSFEKPQKFSSIDRDGRDQCRNRSRSRDRGYRRDRSRSRDRDKRRDRSRSRDKYRSYRSNDRDRHRRH